MNLATAGRKAVIVWRAMHLSALLTALGVLVAVIEPDAANGIGIMLGSMQVAIGGLVATYVNSQGKVDVAETAHGPHPRRTAQMQAVDP